MKKLISGKVLLGITSLLTVMFLSSCLSSDNSRPSKLFVYLQLKGTTTQTGRTDTTLVAGQDSLTISNVRLITGKNQLIRTTNPITVRHAQMLRFSPTPSSTTRKRGNVNLVVKGRGQIIAGTYQAVDFKIVQAADTMRDNNVSIDDIFYDGGHYSVIVKGTYKKAGMSSKSNFTFKSKQSFERNLPFSPPISMPKNNAIANLIVYADIKDWFLDSSGQGFLDPSDENNTTQINLNIQRSFQIRTQSRGTGGSTPEQ